MSRKEDPIAVFDSGVGGISVLKELVKLMPNEDYIFLGDSKNAPYGIKDKEEVQALTLEHASYFLSRGAKAVVVACNTATSVGIRKVRRTYPESIVVGIEPALKPAVLSKVGGRVLVLATPMTLKEKKFANLMEQYSSQAEIIKLPAPYIVEYVEGGLKREQDILDYLNTIFAPYKEEGSHVDSIVLGCTHFPFVKDSIVKAMGYDVMLFDGGLGTAKETRRLLQRAGLLTDRKEKGTITITNSLEKDEMIALSEKLLSCPR
ncbi:MAG: glutamate racemase [Hespellia sp.]|nr:glutamate racemase [Hespellia sp.]